MSCGDYFTWLEASQEMPSNLLYSFNGRLSPFFDPKRVALKIDAMRLYGLLPVFCEELNVIVMVSVYLFK